MSISTLNMKPSNRFYTPDELNIDMKSFHLAFQLVCMHLKISSLSYHHFDLYNVLSNLKIKPNIIEISKTRLQGGKQPITNINLPNYVYVHTPTESGNTSCIMI